MVDFASEKISLPLQDALPNNPKFNFKILIPLIFLIILFIVTLLNYFNILPLSYLYPRQSQRPISLPASSPAPSLTPQIAIACPVPKEFCSKGKIITYQGKDLGLGFNLPPNTQIFTAFPGTLENGAESGGVFKIKTHPVRWLHGIGQFQGVTASYSFFGTPVSSYDASQTIRPFQQQEVMATTSAQTFPATAPFNEVNIIFSIKKNNEPVKFEFKP